MLEFVRLNGGNSCVGSKGLDREAKLERTLKLGI